MSASISCRQQLHCVSPFTLTLPPSTHAMMSPARVHATDSLPSNVESDSKPTTIPTSDASSHSINTVATSIIATTPGVA